ncbi:MAG: RDD family protein [Persicimonas sp.]
MDLVDTIQTVETPEGVEFEMRLAGPVSRSLAAGVDVLIRLAIYLVLGTPFMMLGDAGTGLWMIALFVISWGYPIYFEMYKDGQTPGKMMFDLQVVNADGTPIDWKGSVLRNLLRTADLLPVGYALGLVSMSVTGRFQRLGDVAGDTLVCYHHDGAVPTAASDVPEADPQPTPEPLEVDEQRAIVDFARRSQRLGSARSAELARILAPLSGTQSGPDSVRYLHGLANWIARWS